MSATIRYRRKIKRDPSLSVMAPSSFIDSMKKAFGDFPVTLHYSDITTLKAMAAMHHGEDNPYEKLAEMLLTDYERGEDAETVSIELYAEY